MSEPTKTEPGTDDFAKSYVPKPRVPALTNVTGVLEINLEDYGRTTWSPNADAIRVNIGDDYLDSAEAETLRYMCSSARQIQLVSGNPAVLRFEVERLRETAQRLYQAALLHQQTNPEPF